MNQLGFSGKQAHSLTDCNNKTAMDLWWKHISKAMVSTLQYIRLGDEHPLCLSKGHTGNFFQFAVEFMVPQDFTKCEKGQAMH